MATRRSRIVIKPNIKPTPAKSSLTQPKETVKVTNESEINPIVTASKDKETQSKSILKNDSVDLGNVASVTKTDNKNENSFAGAETSSPIKEKSIKNTTESNNCTTDYSNGNKIVFSSNSMDGDQQTATLSKPEISTEQKQNCNEKDTNIQKQEKEKKEMVKSSRRSRIAVKPNIRPAKIVPSLKEKASPTVFTSNNNHLQSQYNTTVSAVVAKSPTKNVVINEDADIFKNVQSSSVATALVISSSLPSSPAPAEEPPHVQPAVAKPFEDEENKMVELKDKDCISVTSSYEVSCSDEISVAPDDEEPMKEFEEKDVKKKIRRKAKKPEVDKEHPREKSPNRQKMKMGDLLFWNPNQNSLPTKVKKNMKKELVNNVMTTEKAAIDIDHEDEKNTLKDDASLPAPQIMIGPDGNLMINIDSTLIKADKREATVAIEEDDNDRYLNSNSYRTTKKASIWTKSETEMWFIGLSMCGTDFSLLTNLMPHRSRRDLKNKFRREERNNRFMIDQALANRRKYDPEPFMHVKSCKDKPDKKVPVKKEKKELQAEKKKFEKSEEQIKKEKVSKVQKRKKPKKKEVESENEEDDWGSDGDFEMMCEEESAVPPKIKRSKKEFKSEQSAPTNVFSPYKPKVLPTSNKPREKTKPAVESSAAPVLPKMTEISETTNKSNGIQAIPGSTQVQIEMEGVQNPVQGVLIPSNMVPTIAPQLGINNATAGMQVLLVQEETDSGSLVHVYIIPEGTQPSSALSGTGFRPAAQPEESPTSSPRPPQTGQHMSGQSPAAEHSPSPESQTTQAVHNPPTNNTSPENCGNSNTHISPNMLGQSSERFCTNSQVNSANNNTSSDLNLTNRSGYVSPVNQDVHQYPENPIPSNVDQNPTIRHQLSSTPNPLDSTSHPYNIPQAQTCASSLNNPPVARLFPVTMPPPLTPIQNSPPTHQTSSQLTQNRVRAYSSSRPPPPPLVSSSPGSFSPGRPCPTPAPRDSTPPTPSSNLIEMQPAQAFTSQSKRPMPSLDLAKEMSKLNQHQPNF